MATNASWHWNYATVNLCIAVLRVWTRTCAGPDAASSSSFFSSSSADSSSSDSVTTSTVPAAPRPSSSSSEESSESEERDPPATAADKQCDVIPTSAADGEVTSGKENSDRVSTNQAQPISRRFPGNAGNAGMPSVLWCCWLGSRKGIQMWKTEWWGAGVVICLERGAADTQM